MPHETVIPNSMGHQLVVCRATFEKDPPVATVNIEYLPIVAFIRLADGSFEPLLVSGKIIGWGEIRASVVGARIYGICGVNPMGVTTHEHSYASVEEFSAHSKVLIALAVEKVREDKGYPADFLPMRLIRAASDWDGTNELQGSSD